jgi:protein involved in sex pheromone biosynthesis
MNEYVARVLDGLRDRWSVPKMIAEVLEADRKAMDMDEYDYIGHLLATRYNEIRDKGGPGFEKKRGFSSKKSEGDSTVSEVVERRRRDDDVWDALDVARFLKT